MVPLVWVLVGGLCGGRGDGRIGGDEPLLYDIMDGGCTLSRRRIWDNSGTFSRGMGYGTRVPIGGHRNALYRSVRTSTRVYHIMILYAKSGRVCYK